MPRRIASILLTAAFMLVLAACTTTGTGTTPGTPGAVTPEAGAATVEPTAEATVETDTDATPTTEAEEDTGVITDTEEITGTGSMTGTGTMTDTEEITGTQEMTGTNNVTGTQGITGTGSATGMGTINLASSTNMGSYLVDAEGMTLYTFDGEDEADIDTTMWLPVEAGDSDVVGTGLDEGLLGTTDREDGTQQVTYNDRPLYRFIGDLLPGDSLGHGQDQAWWMVNAEGEIVSEDN